MPTAPSIEQHLQELHDDYVVRINLAVADDRDDLIWQLAEAYTAEALRAQSEHGLVPSLDRLPRPAGARSPAA